MAGGWRNPQKKMGTIYRKYMKIPGNCGTNKEIELSYWK